MNQSVNGGGGQPPVRNQIMLFFRKEKKMQNVLKRKNGILMKDFGKFVHLDLF